MVNCITDDNILSAPQPCSCDIYRVYTSHQNVSCHWLAIFSTKRPIALARHLGMLMTLYHSTSPPRQFSAPNLSIICSIAYSPLELDKCRLRFHYSMSFCVGICWVRYMYLLCKYLWKCLMVYCNDLECGWNDFELYLFDTNARVVNQYRSYFLYTHVDCVWYLRSGICDIV